MLGSIYSAAAQLEVSIGILLVMGFIAGFLSGLLGVGGGWLVTPGLNFLGFPMAHAIGTGLAQVMGTSLFGVIRHYRRGHADLKLGSIIGLTMVCSVEAGKLVLLEFFRRGVAELMIRSLYLLLLSSLGAFMLAESLLAGKKTAKKHSPTTGANRPPSLDLTAIGPKIAIPSAGRPLAWSFLVIVGLLAGFLSGLLGVGGGFILVPIFIYLIRMEAIAAVATSLACVFFASVYATITFSLSHLVDIKTAGILLSGSIAGSYFGVWATQYARGNSIKILFSMLLLITGASMALAALGHEQLGKTIVFSTAAGTTIIMIIGVIYQARQRKTAIPR